MFACMSNIKKWWSLFIQPKRNNKTNPIYIYLISQWQYLKRQPRPTVGFHTVVTSTFRMSGQSDEIQTDAPSPWWADRYHSGTDWCPTPPGEVFVCPCMRVCVHSGARRTGSFQPPADKERRKKEMEKSKSGWGAGTGQEREIHLARRNEMMGRRSRRMMEEE